MKWKVLVSDSFRNLGGYKLIEKIACSYQIQCCHFILKKITINWYHEKYDEESEEFLYVKWSFEYVYERNEVNDKTIFYWSEIY